MFRRPAVEVTLIDFKQSNQVYTQQQQQQQITVQFSTCDCSSNDNNLLENEI